MKTSKFSEKIHGDNVKLMGHGASMGIAWGNMENGCMGPKHSSQNFTWFGGDMFWGLGLPRHQNACQTICQNLTCFNKW
jgi:hypothetical protein